LLLSDAVRVRGRAYATAHASSPAARRYAPGGTHVRTGNRDRGGVTETGEAVRRILATYEAGDLITTCAWCKRVVIDGQWVPAPRAALTAIQSRFTLSHSICPQCAAGQPRPATPRPRRSPAR
jgi:hypothetical protein